MQGRGDLRAAISGAISGGAFGWAGGIGGATDPSRYFAHALAGCAGAVAGGGNCGQGALSAFAGKAITNYAPSSLGSFGRFAAASVAGGAASVIGGGKFENGAMTGAFGYLFNELLSSYSENYLKPGKHLYVIRSDSKCQEGLSGCSFSEVVSRLQKIGVYPGQATPLDANKGFQYRELDSLIPGDFLTKDPINSIPVPTGSVNFTTENHLLHNGYVVREVIRYNGYIHVLTTGGGTGWFGGPNVSRASNLWEGIDKEVFKPFNK